MAKINLPVDNINFSEIKLTKEYLLVKNLADKLTDEFEVYFKKLTNPYVGSASADDFMYDLCFSMCLMYQESGKCYFAHRSFQEYFTAVFLSKQKDTVISKLGVFFEKTPAEKISRRGGTHGTISVLYLITSLIHRST